MDDVRWRGGCAHGVLDALHLGDKVCDGGGLRDGSGAAGHEEAVEERGACNAESVDEGGDGLAAEEALEEGGDGEGVARAAGLGACALLVDGDEPRAVEVHDGCVHSCNTHVVEEDWHICECAQEKTQKWCPCNCFLVLVLIIFIFHSVES